MVMKESDGKSEQSHYFIKFVKSDHTDSDAPVDNSIDDMIDRLKKINFGFDNTVGPKSISKQELIKEFNKIL